MHIPDALWFKIRVHLWFVENVLADLLETDPDSFPKADVAKLCRLLQDSVDLNSQVE